MMAPKACVPASTSAAWIFAECGAGASPRSRCIMPDAALTMWAKAARPRQGPVWPKPEMEQ